MPPDHLRPGWAHRPAANVAGGGNCAHGGLQTPIPRDDIIDRPEGCSDPRRLVHSHLSQLSRVTL
jgi:hypothetical protein